MNQEERGKKMQQIVAKAWSDEGFKQKLLSDPKTTLLGEGVKIPAGHELKVMENTSQVSYFVLPMRPSSDELTEDYLDKVAGGACFLCAYSDGVSF